MHQYRLEKISKVFGRRQIAVDGVDLEVERGERVALIGPSGAGKTTLFRMLNCTLRPTAGKLWINGDAVSDLHGKRLRSVRRKIGTIYQQHNLVPRLRVVHNVLSGNLGSWSTLRSLASLLRPQGLEMAYRALRQVGIEEKIFHRTDELSGGQQQRVAIARVLVQDPEVILADEPVSSVDPSLATAIVRLLLDISQNTHKTLLMNLHSVDLALAYFPRVIGIKDGKAVFDRSPDKISDELLEELYSGHLPDSQENGLIDEESKSLIYQ
ncbi:MAG: phosphonate ABC transporter ATP-binding protein [Deltaproteobacteria bacterium GWA2_57_13]|nr:MAG: phosphonate ABC transporter ATP-binding protein [Deltaproteobacteria bacterium GWA2_57_13]OGQ81000.1 MAG: phosphonate ABC transporter ATP-binding protein [Deltaproteobacteria bacterium RIFCSPLOWO2_12_FULL_57_22]